MSQASKILRSNGFSPIVISTRTFTQQTAWEVQCGTKLWLVSSLCPQCVVLRPPTCTSCSPHLSRHGVRRCVAADWGKASLITLCFRQWTSLFHSAPSLKHVTKHFSDTELILCMCECVTRLACALQTVRPSPSSNKTSYVGNYVILVALFSLFMC